MARTTDPDIKDNADDTVKPAAEATGATPESETQTLQSVLVDVLARGMYGAGLDFDTPEGWATLHTTGYELVEPIARVILTAPEICVSLAK
jgi:hypothetical protein